MGRLEAIWVKRAHGGPMDSVQRASANADWLAAPITTHRPVTLIEQEVTRLMADVGGTADPSRRRANLTVSGFPLRDTRGRILADRRRAADVRGKRVPANKWKTSFRDCGRHAGHPVGWCLREVPRHREIAVGDEVSWLESATT